MTKDNVLDSNIEVMKIVKAFNSNEFTKNMLNSWVVTIAKIDSLLKDKKNGFMVDEDIFELDKITEQRIIQSLNSYFSLPLELQKSNEDVTDGKSAIDLLKEQLVAIALQVDKIYESTLENKKLNFMAQHRKMQNISGATSTELDNKATELESEILVEKAPEVLKEKGLQIIKQANLRLNSWESNDFKKEDFDKVAETTGKGLTPMKFLLMAATPLVAIGLLLIIMKIF